MTTNSDQKDVIPPANGEKVLGSFLRKIYRWQRKAASRPEGVKESVRALQNAIQAKTGQETPTAKMGAEELTAFLTNPAHFNGNEQGLIRTLFTEVLRLRRKMDKSGRRKKAKKSFI